jgi:hypothetical protein
MIERPGPVRPFGNQEPVPTPRGLLVSLIDALGANLGYEEEPWIEPSPPGWVDYHRDPAALNTVHDRLLTWCSGYWAGISRLAAAGTFYVPAPAPIPRQLLDELIDALEGQHGDGADRDPAALDAVRDQLIAYLADNRGYLAEHYGEADVSGYLSLWGLQ